jgi:hypothetical protein
VKNLLFNGEKLMQIRKRGLNFQLLRRLKGEKVGEFAHKTIGAFPVTCRNFDDIDEELRASLTRKETAQLQDYMEARQEKREMRVKKRNLIAATEALKEAADTIRKNITDTYDNDHEMLDAYKKLTEALCEHGYGSDIVEIVLTATTKPILDYELDEKSAGNIMSAWKKFRKSLEAHGYTLKWFSAYKRIPK